MTGGLRWEPLAQWSRRQIYLFIAPCNHECKHELSYFLGKEILIRTHIWIGGIEPDPVLRPSPFRVPLLQPGMAQKVLVAWPAKFGNLSHES